MAFNNLLLDIILLTRRVCVTKSLAILNFAPTV